MLRTACALIALLLWCACVLAGATWYRSHNTGDELCWRRLRRTEKGIREHATSLTSSQGGLRLAVRWGTLVDFGEIINPSKHGAGGFQHRAFPPDAYPGAERPSKDVHGRGFGLERGEDPWGWTGELKVRWVGVIVPFWFAVPLLGLYPVLWTRRTLRATRARGAGCCAVCGYDLRATPGRCPECGSEPKTRSHRATPDVPAPVAPFRSRPNAASSYLLLAAVMVGPLTGVPALYQVAFFNGPGPTPQPAPGVAAGGSPTLWAARKLGPPASFKPFVQPIAGSTVKFTMVPVPGGTFLLGSPPAERDRKEDEGPQVKVTVQPFFMGRCEVTQAEYELFAQSFNTVGMARTAPSALPRTRWADAVTYPTPFYEPEAGPILARMGRGAGFPAVTMSHYAARQYTKWLSRKTGRFYRLPTEAEWEYACRAGTKTAYHFGDDPKQLVDYAWTFDNSALSDGGPGYHAVGTKKPNPWGLYDMHGNVAEWVLDGYAAGHYAGLSPGPVAAVQAINWPTKRYPRVIRGGGYESEPVDCRSASRFASNSHLNKYDTDLIRGGHWESAAFWVGFRVVCPVREPPEAEKHRHWDDEDPSALRPFIERDERQVRELIPPYK